MNGWMDYSINFSFYSLTITHYHSDDEIIMYTTIHIPRGEEEVSFLRNVELNVSGLVSSTYFSVFALIAFLQPWNVKLQKMSPCKSNEAHLI